TLGRRNEPRATRALAAALAGDPFWAVRAEAAKALGDHKTDAALEALVAAEGDADPRVRRSIASALGRFRRADAADRLLAWIDRGDPSYLVEAALRRSLGQTRDPRAFEALVAALGDPAESWGDVVRGAAVEGLGALNDPR